MVSKLAESAIDDLFAEGLKPSVKDIVRLNALGLKVEAAAKRAPHLAPRLLPRVAFLAEGVYFREPTIGHQIWCDRIEAELEPGDFESLLAVKAFALSRPQESLPNADDIERCRREIEKDSEKFRPFTRAQIFAAIDYCLYGDDALALEHPPATENADDEDAADWAECYAVGLMNEARALQLGLTGADLRGMTQRELEGLIERVYELNGMVDKKKRSSEITGGFYAALDEIRERLKNGG
jgi:hypothetical protein